MAKIMIGIIIVTAIANMVADILLVSGKDYKNKQQTILDVIENTKDKNIIRSGIIGACVIPFWIGVLYFLSYIEHPIGKFLSILFAMFIASIAVFHVMCSNVYLLYKHSNLGEAKLKKLLINYAIPCVVFSVSYTGLMIYAGISGILHLSVFQYVTLPFFSTLLIQVGLGNLFKYKHFDSISGSVSMLVTMLSTISIIAGNYTL